MVTLTAILVLSLILPNYTTSSTQRHGYNTIQLSFIAVLCLVVYLVFIMIQAVRHRSYFLSPEESDDENLLPVKPTLRTSLISAVLLLLCLGVVVLLAKTLAPAIEKSVLYIGAPKSLVGVIIAAIVLLPEGIAALRAAVNNRLQTSLNLALGSALASIGLTIPAVAFTSIVAGMQLTLGVDPKATVLLLLSLFTLVVSLATGRTHILQGIILLAIFILYIFLFSTHNSFCLSLSSPSISFIRKCILKLGFSNSWLKLGTLEKGKVTVVFIASCAINVTFALKGQTIIHVKGSDSGFSSTLIDNIIFLLPLLRFLLNRCY
ncbi:calcium:proton antiporter [Niabella hibiscisoli]|uniref:calcium:proton antiporter n=1 Tax=Niabella hibiscisoli TaxID=1825928 RepID=UPI001F103E27|nr:hypothetical protein [Niabella hibiscisoli]MCH5719396.1 hypothetical protein [Niabella hibiscisoli]